MAGIDSTDLSIIRILEILKKHTDEDHPMTQVEIATRLKNEFGIELERKAIARKIALLDSAEIFITKTNKGCYYDNRTFDEAELRLLIDSVLCSRHINDKKTKDIIEKLCSEETVFFKKSLKHFQYISQCQNTNSHDVFTNIDMITNAIENKLVIKFQYLKYDIDKELKKSSTQNISPYVMILHNQRYYLMGYSHYWHEIKFLRIDRMTNMDYARLTYTDLKLVPGYEQGINFKELTVNRPYLFNDKLEDIKLKVKKKVIDYVIDWFGTDIKIKEIPDEKSYVIVTLKSSPNAMSYWAIQYVEAVEVLEPISLREEVGKLLRTGISKYANVIKEKEVKEPTISLENNETSIFYNVYRPINVDDVEDLTKEIVKNK